MHPKGTIIPLGTTSECFNKGKIHPVIHSGGNAWVKRVWISLANGETWEYPTTSGAAGKVKLIKRENPVGWEVA
jgi:hypothetical protein